MIARAVLPKIQANEAGAADALMLDLEGFVSETNATNVFMVKKGVVYTPCPDYCLPGKFVSTCRAAWESSLFDCVSIQSAYLTLTLPFYSSSSPTCTY